MAATLATLVGSAMTMCANCGRYNSTVPSSFGAASRSAWQHFATVGPSFRFLQSSRRLLSTALVIPEATLYA